MNASACATTDNQIQWSQIDWDKCNDIVRKLQVRIVIAQQEGRFGKVKSLQWLLTHSFSAKVVAVKRVTVLICKLFYLTKSKLKYPTKPNKFRLFYPENRNLKIKMQIKNS
jgi:hypothetical protein